MDELAHATREFAEDVAKGLTAKPKRIPSKYLYDALGSRLFEAICELPWYPITRAELSLLKQHGHAMTKALGSRPTLVELGCGSGDKTAVLADHASAGGPKAIIHLIDISPTALELSEKTLARQQGLEVQTHCATYQQGVREIADNRPGDGPLLVLFLGSNVGNFPSGAGVDLLASIASALRPEDGVLLGTDLIKAEQAMLLAYSDPLGVTAAFNLNLLRRANDELGADFDLDAFSHRAVFNAAEERMESYLVCERAQRVRVPLADLTVDLAPGERVWTETSQKYTRRSIDQLAVDSGFSVADQWIDPGESFAVTLLRPKPRS